MSAVPTSTSVESSPFVSPTQSPHFGPTSSNRRLSARRGSIAAADPWGEHADVNLNPGRATASRLTIVRVPPPTEPDDGRRHRRHGSGASINSTSSGKGDNMRMSFAFSSFAPSGTNNGRASPPSPRMRPSTPGSPRQSFSSLPSMQPKLSPEQLVELAKQSVNPRPSANGSHSSGSVHPVSFTPLPDSIFLPFIERPAEVTHLITQPPTNKLFALLAQTFPSPSSPSPSTSPSEYTSTTVPPPSADSDPKHWTYAQLISWLRNVDRDVADDIIWVRKARACILERSELIWERIRGALGVPPELNVDDDELEVHTEEESARGAIDIPRPKCLEAALDVPVFEPDSPVTSSAPYTAPSSAPANPPGSFDDADVLLSSSVESLSVEPVIATPVSPNPPPTSSTSLTEVREEDEEEDTGEGAVDNAKDPNLLDAEGPEVMGIRFSTSPTVSVAGNSPVMSPVGTLSRSSSLGRSSIRPSFSGLPRFHGHVGGGMPNSPSIRGIGRSGSFSSASGDEGYDANFERGPGRPLFPSNFSQLSMGPTLRGRRSQSNTHPPPSGLPRAGALTQSLSFANLNISGQSASGGRPRIPGLPSRSDFDMGKHEYAVSTGSGTTVE